MLCRLVVTSAMLVGMGASASNEAAPRSAFGPGEQLTFKVAFLGMTAGTAEITVGSEMQHWGRTVWPIVALAKSESLGALYDIKDKFVTYWDHAEHRTIGSDLFAEENRKRRRQRIRLEGTSAHVTKQNHGASEVEETHEVAPFSMDVAAVTFALRNKALAIGQTHEMPVFTGARSFILKATVEGVQKLSTPLGERDVFKVRVATQFSGKLAAKRDLYAYLTTDEARVPVRVEAEFLVGSITADLTDYKPGRSLAAVDVP